MLAVPLQPVANQTLQVLVDNQACTIDLASTPYGLFMSLSVDGAAIISGVLCQNRNRIVRSAYLGFSGDFVFVDTQGDSDPDYTGLGTRFMLVWISSDEVTQLAA